MNQLIKSLTALIGIALFAFLFVFYGWEMTKVSGWQKSGTPRSLAWSADSVTVFTRVEAMDFPQPPVPDRGDTLVTIGDLEASQSGVDTLFNRPRSVGEEVPISFRHQGVEQHTVIRCSLPAQQDVAAIMVLQVLRFLITFLFVIVALWAFFKRPDSAAVRTLALFSFAMAAFMISSVSVLHSSYAAFSIPYYRIIRIIVGTFAALFGAFWMNLQFQFPRPIRFMQRHPAWAYAVCYLPSVVFAAANIASSLFDIEISLDGFFLPVLGGQVVAGTVILVARHLRTTDRVEKRQTRLVLWGTGLALICVVLLIVVFQAFTQWFASNTMRAVGAVTLVFLSLLLSPISFAYAFGRYRLLEVEARLRRGTRYLFAIGFLTLLGAGAAYGATAFVRSNLEGGSFWVVPIMMILAAGILPAARALQRFLENRFYPERRQLREMIHDFLERSAALADQQTFWSELEQRLRDGLTVESVYPVVRADDNKSFLLRDRLPTPFAAGSELIEWLERDRRPLMMDEVIAARVVRLTSDELDWVMQHRVALILPLVTRNRLIGLLGLGMKIEEEDYAAEELRILSSLTTQMAVATESIRLLEENVGKRRLEDELKMARRIQRGFLPDEVPPTPGLDVAAASRFCLEVAGDYYDIISLENGDTVLAVGDVSGKGAGAALLMANLQASLRTGVGVGVPLSDVVSRINDLIYRNTPVEEYITFFVAVFHPSTSTLTYVNAGHNPPLVMRTTGDVERLDRGGLLLGTFPNRPYEQGSVVIAPGELVFMYTDGVSEAMNPEQEEFGESRIVECLVRHGSAPPRALLEHVESAVLRYRGDAPLEDDFTLLLARAAVLRGPRASA